MVFSSAAEPSTMRRGAGCWSTLAIMATTMRAGLPGASPLPDRAFARARGLGCCRMPAVCRRFVRCRSETRCGHRPVRRWSFECRRADELDGPDEVGVDDVGDLFVGELLGRSEQAVAGVAHDHVDAPEFGESTIDDRTDRGGVGDVEHGGMEGVRVLGG